MCQQIRWQASIKNKMISTVCHVFGISMHMFFVSLNAYMAEEETNMQLQKSIESFDELEYQKKMLTEQQFQNSGALTAFKQST